MSWRPGLKRPAGKQLCERQLDARRFVAATPAARRGQFVNCNSLSVAETPPQAGHFTKLPAGHSAELLGGKTRGGGGGSMRASTSRPEKANVFYRPSKQVGGGGGGAGQRGERSRPARPAAGEKRGLLNEAKLNFAVKCWQQKCCQQQYFITTANTIKQPHHVQLTIFV